jgi:ParB family transcriptional regulator, chromosome partitioning protein
MLFFLLPEFPSTSNLMLGIIEEIEIHYLDHSPVFYPSISSCIDDLCRSIKEKGLLHPITVRTRKKDEEQQEQRRFQIVAGNRRYLACKALGWRKILCHIVELDDREAFEISLVENIQRRTLNPIEEAYAFKAYVLDFGWGGVSDLSTKIGKSVSYVDRRLGLLLLPEEVLMKVMNSSMDVSAAQELIPIQSKSEQSKLAEIISRRHLSIKQVRKLVANNYDNGTQDIMPSVHDDVSEIDKRAQRSLDKSIVALRMAMKKITDIMESVEDNWIIYEILLQHKHVLHTQIDVLIREKKKL